jgi:dual specificity MAP kinase phosphatase
MALNLLVYGTSIVKPKNCLHSSQTYASSQVSKTLVIKSQRSSDTSSIDAHLPQNVPLGVDVTAPQICLDVSNLSPCSLEHSAVVATSEQATSELSASDTQESCATESTSGFTDDRCFMVKHSLSGSKCIELPQNSSPPEHSENLSAVEGDTLFKQRVVSSAITPCELVQLVNKDESCLLQDSRTFIAFNANHISGALNVSCSDRITRKRLIDGKINIVDVISGQEGKDLYRRLSEGNAQIVVYDESTMELCSLPTTHPLRLLTDCLHKHGKQSRFLLGGLQAFQESYSCMCSQPDISGGVPLLFSPTSPEVNCDIDTAVASEILPHLLIGNQRDAASRERLTELGVTHILNVTALLPLHFESDGIVYKRLPASDSGSQNLKQYFMEAIEFIDNARAANGRVLVHCQAGVSRSPTIVIAYLIAKNRKNLSEAFSFVKDRRSIVAPNLNFMGQLLEFDQQSVLRSGLCPPAEPLHLLRV